MAIGALTKLQRSFAYRVSQRFPGQFLRWIDAVSAILDNLTGGTQAEVRYVNKAGNDTTGDGSFDNPFLTIAAAMASITDAGTTKPYTVRVEAGVYGDAFTIKNGVYIVGAGAGSGNFNGAPVYGATYILPAAGQVLAADWAGAADKAGGISNCALLGPLTVNFSTIGDTGLTGFLIDDVNTISAVTIVGSAAVSTLITIRDLYINAVADLTLTDLYATTITDFMSDFGGKIVATQAAALQSFHDWLGIFVSGITATWTSALLANTMIIILRGGRSNVGPVLLALTGAGVNFNSDTETTATMPNAASNIGFGASATPDIIGIVGGTVHIDAAPTANRLFTINKPIGTNNPTKLVIRNLSTGDFNVDLSFVGGGVSVTPGSPTYVPPSSTVKMTFNAVSAQWAVEPYVQGGTVTLANGVSAAIPADITARSRITATSKAFNGATGTISAKAADRVIGTRAGGGSFKLTAIAAATGATVATDAGDYDWHVDNAGG
jgi:hypothetical protein